MRSMVISLETEEGRCGGGGGWDGHQADREINASGWGKQLPASLTARSRKPSPNLHVNNVPQFGLSSSPWPPTGEVMGSDWSWEEMLVSSGTRFAPA
jgi:hypothetical protein